MTTAENKKRALRTVTEATQIHASNLRESVKDRFNGDQPGFRSARLEYVSKLETALREVSGLKFDGDNNVMQRVGDLTLEESVDLLLAVEDHIRELRRYNRSELA